MLLKDFIVETLTSIVDGLTECQGIVKKNGTEVAPPQIGGSGQIVNPEEVPIYNVSFEVELTETTSESGKKGIGVAFGNIGAGVSNQNGSNNTATTRIQFVIPITYPCRNTVKGWL